MSSLLIAKKLVSRHGFNSISIWKNNVHIYSHYATEFYYGRLALSLYVTYTVVELGGIIYLANFWYGVDINDKK